MKLTVIGASGHGRVVADIAFLNGYDLIEFLDDNEAVDSCGKWRVVGKTDKAENIGGDLFVAVGNPAVRKMLTERFCACNIVTLIHPSAVVASDAVIGAGTAVMAGAVINPNVKIGKGCIVNTCSSVDHDCVIDDYAHVSVGAHLSGTVKVGRSTWIGAGATVSNNIDICADCVIGAGAVVVRDLTSPGTYVGVPAKRIK